MAKAKNISSTVERTADGMRYTLEGVDSGERETITVRWSDILPDFDSLPELAQKALFFGFRTRLRNETAGKPFAEAVANIRETLDDFARGVWATARAAGGEGRASLLVEAIVRASNGKYDAKTAADLVNGKIAEIAQAKGLDPDSEDEETVKALGQIRSAVRKAFLEKPAVGAAFAAIQAERTAAKAAALAKAAEGATFEG